ncbi:hypothetical protein ElyMa_004444900 [Elysia marginata]|uniref:Uncharacterized protein n=1 Tax=Elysia marginata TaxID=1093978 RepID=A0AAV4HES9_9GAST|nr:hypothetical protein ElyMa_004444900 [Elysia marginata]
MAVETCAGNTRRTKALITSPAIDCVISASELKKSKQQDASLAVCRKLTDTGETRRSGKENCTRYGYDKYGILIRMFSHGQTGSDNGNKQEKVPQPL